MLITCIKGSLARYMNFERLYKSRLIVGDSIFSIEEKGVVQTWKRTCIGTMYVDITDLRKISCRQQAQNNNNRT